MCDVSKATVDELKLLRKYLLLRFDDTSKDDPRRNNYRRYVNLIALELVRRTGDNRWKL